MPIDDTDFNVSLERHKVVVAFKGGRLKFHFPIIGSTISRAGIWENVGRDIGDCSVIKVYAHPADLARGSLANKRYE